jgi:hypothetical protein
MVMAGAPEQVLVALTHFHQMQALAPVLLPVIQALPQVFGTLVVEVVEPY